jgi:hypothetical protein
MDRREDDPMSFKRNLHSLGYLLLVRCGTGSLLLRQSRDPRCDVTSCNRVSIYSLLNTILHIEISKEPRPDRRGIKNLKTISTVCHVHDADT